MDHMGGGVIVSPVKPVKGPESRAGRTVFILIGINLVLQVALGVAAVVADLDLVTSVRVSLVAALAIYAAAAVWVTVRARSLGIRPDLGRETAVAGAAEGFVVGAGLAVLMVALLRLAFGSPVLDPVAALLAGDGSVGPLLLGALVVVVVAPLVEELVFRGFLAGAFRVGGRWNAIIVSMIAFGLVHLRLAQLRYYMLLGLALAVVYLRRGLIGSVCTHAAFNGLLLLAALAAVRGPLVEVDAAGAHVTLPAAWSSDRGTAGDDLVATGPAGTRVELAHADIPGSLRSPDQVAAALSSGSLSLPEGISVATTGVVVLDLPAGRAVSADATVDGDDGRLVMIPKGNRLWVMAMRSAGSARDDRDFDAILQSWRLP